jgi:hypothetical protein
MLVALFFRNSRASLGVRIGGKFRVFARQVDTGTHTCAWLHSRRMTAQEPIKMKVRHVHARADGACLPRDRRQSVDVRDFEFVTR